MPLMRTLALFSSDLGLGPSSLRNLGKVLVIVDVESESELLRLVEARHADLIVLGGARTGVPLAERVRRLDRVCPIILLATPEWALEAMRVGINDVLDANCSEKALLDAVARLHPHRNAAGPCLAHSMVGESHGMADARRAILQVARAQCNVLLTGETGVGKELAAESIHRHSSRVERPFVPVNCAAIPDSLLESELFGWERGAFTGAFSRQSGKLQAADSGTLFLDEIGDMDLRAQAKILRVIETRRVRRLGSNQDMDVDIRVVAATNHDLEDLIAKRLFREDLYYRLNVAHIHIPPLRERRDDIPVLAAHLLRELAARVGRPEIRVSAGFFEALSHYDWPGNVRELRNVLESALVFCASGCIDISDLPANARVRLGIGVRKPHDEREQLLGALSSASWNKSEAAKLLHWSRMTLYRKMRKHRIGPTPESKTLRGVETA